MMRSFLVFGLYLTSFFSFSQIVIGEPEEEKKPAEVQKETVIREKKVVETDGINSIYFVTNWSVTNRSLVPNGDLFGKELGKRVDETSLNTWSFGIGLRNRFGSNYFWDGGISFYRNGESYLFTDMDTMFAYQTYYNYIAMPLRVNAFVGDKFKFSAGAGIVPQMFSSYRQEQQWETTTQSKGKETIKTKSGYNSFAVSAIVNIGLTMDFDNGWSVLVSPEFRWQLTSSYTKIAPYIHKGQAYGVTFGLIRNL
jgi:hypothetical protein